MDSPGCVDSQMERQQPKYRRFTKSRRHPRVVAAIVVAVMGFAALAPLAHASSDPTSAQYKSAVTEVSNGVDGGSGSSPAHSTSGLEQRFVGVLPFTGLDLLAVIAVAMALTSLGFALRWLTTGRDQRL